MPFDPVTYLELAKGLIAAPQSVAVQARHRAAVSRAYYAAFLRLKQRIEEVQGPNAVPKTNPHAKILNALRQTRASALTDIKSRLEALKEERERADYELNVPDLTSGNVDATIVRAERAINKIEQASSYMLGNLRF